MSKYLLSPNAKKHLKEIRDYTRENYGEQQKKSYMKMLKGKMQQAAKSPDKVGVDRSDIKLGYYSIRADKHHIYYRIHDTHIDIIDVLHQSMDPSRHI